MTKIIVSYNFLIRVSIINTRFNNYNFFILVLCPKNSFNNSLVLPANIAPTIVSRLPRITQYILFLFFIILLILINYELFIIMIKGEKVRFDIHNILFSIYKLNLTLNNNFIKKIINRQKREDIALLHSVTLNSMRYHLHCLKIIDKYIKKKIRDHEKILLISAITQIVFLEFKEYAVINCSVEIAKKLKLYSGLLMQFKKILKISRV